MWTRASWECVGEWTWTTKRFVRIAMEHPEERKRMATNRHRVFMEFGLLAVVRLYHEVLGIGGRRTARGPGRCRTAGGGVGFVPSRLSGPMIGLWQSPSPAGLRSSSLRAEPWSSVAKG